MGRAVNQERGIWEEDFPQRASRGIVGIWAKRGMDAALVQGGNADERKQGLEQSSFSLGILSLLIFYERHRQRTKFQLSYFSATGPCIFKHSCARRSYVGSQDLFKLSI